MILELHYGPRFIGIIQGASWSDDTGYGTLRPVGRVHTGTRRVHEYIAFSRDWHERLRAGCPHEAAEFDAYRDIHDSEEWCAVAQDGSVHKICGPVFVEDEITWRPSPICR